MCLRSAFLKVAFFTLGCKVNQNETNALQQLFLDNNYVLSENNELADVYIVNSCTVTAGGDKKSLHWLRRAKQLNPSAVTVLTGCLPQAFPEKSASILDADIITGSKNRASILHNIEDFLRHRMQIIDIDGHTNADIFEELPITKLRGHTRAFIKIEDGCNRFCTYCIIPYARGRVRSRKEENILSEVETLCNNGYKEVVLTGINLACYGNDTSTDLPTILEKISHNPRIERIRLSSLEPGFLTKEQLVRLTKIKKLCTHFHFSLQSGCDETLLRMGRNYDTSLYMEQMNFLKNNIPNSTFTTDIIVGFPGETDANFKESMNFVKSCNFLKVHVFSYSAREGTSAASFPDQVPIQIKKIRHKKMAEVAKVSRNNTAAHFAGTTAKVLLEKNIGDNFFYGYTENYIPIVVYAPNNNSGEIVNLKLLNFESDRYTSTLL